jgi:hypothetical protein
MGGASALAPCQVLIRCRVSRGCAHPQSPRRERGLLSVHQPLQCSRLWEKQRNDYGDRSQGHTTPLLRRYVCPGLATRQVSGSHPSASDSPCQTRRTTDDSSEYCTPGRWCSRSRMAACYSCDRGKREPQAFAAWHDTSLDEHLASIDAGIPVRKGHRRWTAIRPHMAPSALVAVVARNLT